MPESVRFLVLQGNGFERVRATLKRIAPQENVAGATFVVHHAKAQGFPVDHLFKPDLIKVKLLLWLAFFMSLLVRTNVDLQSWTSTS